MVVDGCRAEETTGILSLARRLPESDMATTDRIEINDKIMMGKPVIRGTCVTAELILRKLGEGATEGEIPAAYPQLKKPDLQAAMAYAADTLAHEETIARR